MTQNVGTIAANTYHGAMSRDIPSIPSPDVTLRQLECFVAVADAGTVTGAASRIHSSGSAVSDAISALERAIGVPLMVRRRSQGISLTSTGKSILSLAREVLARSAELEALARGTGTRTAPVRIGAIHSLGPTLLPRLIRHFAAQHPDTDVSYTIGRADQLANQLASGDLDATITYDLDFPLEFVQHELLRSRALVVLPERHRLAGRERVNLTELADEPFVLHDVPPSRQYALDVIHRDGVTPARIHATDNYDLCRSLVGEGLGWSILLGRRFAPETWGGRRVAEVPIHPPVPEITVVLSTRDEALPQRVADLVPAAKRAASELFD